MIDLLVLGQSLINLRFQGTAAPHERPVLTFLLGNLSEPIVLQGVSDDLHLIIIKLEVIPSISWLVRSDTYWVLIRSENQELLLYFRTDFLRPNVFRIEFRVLGVFLLLIGGRNLNAGLLKQLLLIFRALLLGLEGLLNFLTLVYQSFLQGHFFLHLFLFERVLLHEEFLLLNISAHACDWRGHLVHEEFAVVRDVGHIGVLIYVSLFVHIHLLLNLHWNSLFLLLRGGVA